MSKSAISTENTTTQVLASGATIALGNVIRRFGCNLKLQGNAINVSGGGYYMVDSNITIVGTNAGTVTVTLFKDNVAYTSRSVTLAVGDVITIPLDTLIREFGCCMDSNSNLTFVLGGTAETVSDISVTVVKL